MISFINLAETIKGKFDVAFLIDSSGSLKDDYKLEKDFVKSLALAFGVSKYGSRCAVITFSEDAEHSIKLNDHTDIYTFNDAVDDIPLMGSVTRIDKALRMAQAETFTLANGARSGYRKLIILLTDGSQTISEDAEDPIRIADEMRRHGVTVLVVGVGSGINPSELTRLGGSYENTFTASSFHELVGGDILKQLTDKSTEIGKVVHQILI